jgi:hypothetical protein
MAILACGRARRVQWLGPSFPHLSESGLFLHEGIMYHYDASIALEELQEDALLPHPVKLRDMILRTQLGPEEAKALNHEFQDYLTRFGELQTVARGILEKIAAGRRKAS